ncbi:hypothetical protein RHSIM_Rhsim02G0094600 [Rhododendron simsii]|uniref:AAA+ ATPase domain-containing protein n=1 Tax=Rhododendron simsii TaxID=118357 RepID=A0A834LWY9_RHOSS|nr:hypothetical protein RHSIM_Rhsim02G0094600 [Rhododendron simsii]
MSSALIAITCLGKIAGSLLVKIGDYVVAPMGRQFTYMFCFNSNITEVEAQLKELEVTRKGVQMGVDYNRRKVRVIGPNVEAWLKSANEVTIEVGGIIQEKPKVKEGCLNGWCPNIKMRYSLSRKAVKTTEVIIDLQARGVQYTQSSYSPPPPCLETILNRDFTGFESRSVTMEEIIKALKHDHFNLIGVCGMGGVGKTTMVNEVAKRAKEENHFDEVAMAVVSKDPNLTNVQACIADMLGLKLVDRDSPMVRADLLRKRLLQDNKKVLVILDDIWEDFDLQAMGIPLECANTNFKLLYTSRTQDLWHDVQTKKEIPLQLLSEDEAWQLFREKAGDSADARDLHPIAKQIVNECGGLPLALVLIGGVLSTKSGRNPIKEIWEGMLDRLICASCTPANERLFSCLELSYKYLEDEEAKRLFLLCCLFKEDEDIRINNLAMYGLGLSLFDGINEMEKARRRVFLIVDDLKSRYLLLDSNSKKEECVRLHDVVRDMGISIASKDNVALVSHGALSKWPKTVTYDPYTAISVISDKITKLPEGLAYPNLEFLILRCRKLEKLPPNFFEGMGKLKVLEIGHFDGILTFQSLRNLTTLSLEGFRGKLDNLSIIGDLLNLETLNFRDSGIEELPEEIGELVNLRLLDLRGTRLRRIPPGVISHLVRLEELYMGWFDHWEGEDNEAKGRNANLIEFESLSNLNTLAIEIKRRSRSEFSIVACIPTVPIFSKLEIYKVFINDRLCWEGHWSPGYAGFANHGIYYGPSISPENCFLENCKRMLGVKADNLILSYRGGIDSLLRRSDLLSLRGSGCDDLVRELLCQVLVDGHQQLKYLYISDCHVTQECLVNAMNPVQLSRAAAVFPILEVLWIDQLANVTEISRSPIPPGSFGELTSIKVTNCRQLRHLFPVPIVGCLPQLTDLQIEYCDMMEEVIWREQREDVHVATNRIEFLKLESLSLSRLPSLKGFCRGIDHIDFPQLKRLNLRRLERLNCLFHNNSTSHSEENDNAGFVSLFAQMVSLSKLMTFTMSDCNNLLCVFPSHLLPMLRDLETLQVKECTLLEVVFALEAGVHSNEPNPEILSPLKHVKLYYLPKLSYISKRDPTGFQYIQFLVIIHCDWLRYVFAPTVTKSIPQLRTLEISSCVMLSRIVAEENGLGESSVDEVEFPRLEKLVLYGLPNLVNFFPNGNTTLPKSTDHLHTTMQSQPLLNEKVTFPSLKVLILEWLPNVSDIWSSELPDFSFFKLKELVMYDMRSLRNMSHPSLARVLWNLQTLKIDNCWKMKAVVDREEEIEDGQTIKIEKTLFPELTDLLLSKLPNLTRFCHFTHPIECHCHGSICQYKPVFE